MLLSQDFKMAVHNLALKFVLASAVDWKDVLWTRRKCHNAIHLCFEDDVVTSLGCWRLKCELERWRRCNWHLQGGGKKNTGQLLP